MKTIITRELENPFDQLCAEIESLEEWVVAHYGHTVPQIDIGRFTELEGRLKEMKAKRDEFLALEVPF